MNKNHESIYEWQTPKIVDRLQALKEHLQAFPGESEVV